MRQATGPAITEKGAQITCHVNVNFCPFTHARSPDDQRQPPVLFRILWKRSRDRGQALLPCQCCSGALRPDLQRSSWSLGAPTARGGQLQATVSRQAKVAGRPFCHHPSGGALRSRSQSGVLTGSTFISSLPCDSQVLLDNCPAGWTQPPMRAQDFQESSELDYPSSETVLEGLTDKTRPQPLPGHVCASRELNCPGTSPSRAGGSH